MISKKIGTLEHWNKTCQKVLIYQGFLMFQFFLIIGTMFQKIGTYWNNWNKRPRLLLFLHVKPAGMQNNSHTRKACARACCFSCVILRA